MALTLILIILGLVVGVIAAYVYRELSPPPGTREPRPNRKKFQLQQFIIPGVVMVLVVLTGWGVKSLLFGPAQPEPAVETVNVVSSPVSDGTHAGADETVVNLDEREALTSDSIMAQAAIRSVPLSSNLAVMGARLKLGRPSVKDSAPIQEENPEPKPAPKPAAKAVQAPKSAAAPPKRAEPAPPKAAPKAEPKAAAKAPPEEEAGLVYTVHLASFQSKENAERALTKLKAAGDPAFINQVELDGKVYYRLMSGRFPTREKAENHGLALQSQGLTSGMERFVIRPFVAGGGPG
ncbi:MAG: SPOR domain-containing protein [Pseudomonadota bacterium]